MKITTTTDTAVTARENGKSLVQMWLLEKSHKSGSLATVRTYSENMAYLQAFLGEHQLRLDSGQHDPNSPEFAAVVKAVRAWYGLPDRVRLDRLSASTMRLRLAVISSFYRFAIRQPNSGYQHNPVDRIERPSGKAKPNRARALSRTVVEDVLAGIDREDPPGKRAYAFLLVALATGRRAAELGRMRIQDIQDQDGNPAFEQARASALQIQFPRTKGGKSAVHRIPWTVGEAVIDWLAAAYPDGLRRDYPVWRSLARRNKGIEGMRYGSLRYMCRIYYGTTKIHALRHTAAHLLDERDVAPRQIQHMLGHDSLDTTQMYLDDLRSEVVMVNPLEGVEL